MDIENFYEHLFKNRNKLKEYKYDILKNSNSIIEYLNINDVVNSNIDIKRIEFVWNLINFLSSNNIDLDKILTLRDLSIKYLNDETIKYANKTINKFLRSIYNSIITSNENELGLELFTDYSNRFPNYIFSSAKAYAIYFAYQLKRFKNIQILLDNFYIYNHSDDYTDYVDFCIMNFYKGLYFLSIKDYCKSAICFLMNLNNICPQVIHYLQLESLKRIFLLYNLVEGNLKLSILNILNKFKLIFSRLFSNSSIYLEFQNLINNNKPFKDIEKFIKEYNLKLKLEKTYGLFKIVMRNYGYNIINKRIEIYKRIKIQKLSELCEMDSNTIIYLLKLNYQNNGLNIKINEVEQILEVQEDIKENNNNNLIKDLKKTYENNIYIQKELIHLIADNLKVNEKDENNLKNELIDNQESFNYKVGGIDPRYNYNK